MRSVDFNVESLIATVTLNRPSALNAINREVLRELSETFTALSGREDVHVVIVRGGGEKAFAAGADIAEMPELSQKQAFDFSWFGHQTFEQIETFALPVIAAVDGFALGGGCELALACDFIYASSASKLGQPEVNLGLIPGFGGTQRLTRRIGIGHARELLYTGQIIDAQEALRVGLVNRVFPQEKFWTEVGQAAHSIASKSPLALAAIKRVVRRGSDMALSDANRLEAEEFGRAFTTEDAKEGIAAFLQKRRPRFHGR